MSQRIARLDTTLREALQDSVRVAERLRMRSQLEDRRDSLAARVALIEKVDARRYDWPHLLEEIAIATPERVWITRISDVTSGQPRTRFRVEGKALDSFGLTRFWNALEASFFVKDVELVATEHNPVRDMGPDANVPAAYHFAIEAGWEEPPQDILDFVSLEEMGT